MKYLTFSISGMNCAGCVDSVASALKKLKGARRVEVTLEPGTAILRVDTARLNVAQIEAAISALGFSAKLQYTGPDEQGLP